MPSGIWKPPKISQGSGGFLVWPISWVYFLLTLLNFEGASRQTQCLDLGSSSGEWLHQNIEGTNICYSPYFIYISLFETKISADASSHDLGAVILQKTTASHWKPVTFALRSMTPTEMYYAQIEKALVTTWACEKFSDYILGKEILIETDHKPLIPLFNTKNLDTLPPRILKF